MDAELREYLDEKFRQVDDRFQQVDERFQQVDERFRQVDEKFVAFGRQVDEKITVMAQHILHEMDMRFTNVDKRLESIDSRMKLQAGLNQSGARAIARLSEYAESSETRYVDLLAKFDNLERRVMKLETPGQE